MGHPVNVVFHSPHPHHPAVSPVVHSYYGGETLLRDLRRVVSEVHVRGASDAALALAVRWCLEYGQHTVALYNLDTPGLPVGSRWEDTADSYRIRLDWVRGRIESDPEWVLVDLAEFRAVSKGGVWELDEERHAEPTAAADPARKAGPGS